jgi:hypothetical protein
MKAWFTAFMLVIVVLFSGCDHSEDLDGDGYVDCTRAVRNFPGGHDPFGCFEDNEDGVVTHDYGGFNVAVHDCDDDNPDINPDVTEICDGLDNNCNGSWDEDVDCDGDGYVAQQDTADASGDCDAHDAAVYPGAPEIIDGRDNDCDGQCLLDECSDDTGAECPCRETIDYAVVSDPGCRCSTSTASVPTFILILTGVWILRRRRQSRAALFGLLWLSACAQVYEYPSPERMMDLNDADDDGYHASDDCNDENSSVHPGAVDLPFDGIDQDCDGRDGDTGDTGFADTDTDTDSDSDTDTDTDTDTAVHTSMTGDTGIIETGHTGQMQHTGHTGQTGTTGATGTTGDTGVVIATGDTAQTGDTGSIDPTTTDDDGDGYCEASCTDGSTAGDCDDTQFGIHPGALELCNGLDDNCTAGIDEGVGTVWYRDADTDTYGNSTVQSVACTQPNGYVSNSTDCDDTRSNVHPGGVEICDGLDNDCVGGADTGVNQTWYADSDGDSYGDASTTTLACVAPNGYVADGTDCNDMRFDIYPGAVESCDPLDTDEDCSGAADDADPGVDVLSYVTYYKDNDLDGVPIAGVQDSNNCEPSNNTFILPVDVTGDGSNDWDCNDADPTINPGVSIDPAGLPDLNCDGTP